MTAKSVPRSPVVRLESPLELRQARHVLRAGFTGDGPAMSVIVPADAFHVVGEVHGPDFTITGIAPSSSGSLGPIRWRAPLTTRPLRGTIIDGSQGGATLEGRFRSDRAYATRKVRELEAQLLTWLEDRLCERPSPAAGSTGGTPAV